VGKNINTNKWYFIPTKIPTKNVESERMDGTPWEH